EQKSGNAVRNRVTGLASGVTLDSRNNRISGRGRKIGRSSIRMVCRDGRGKKRRRTFKYEVRRNRMSDWV
uniref:hypothetical protein n=1 Tax=Staphylococcus aureus TaxID=1280 RepID=UPI001C92C198